MSENVIARACDLTLKNDQFQQDFIQLVKEELTSNSCNLTSNQVTNLLETASLFSLNNQDNYKKIASKIAIFLLNNYSESFDNIPFITELVLTRLGDLPIIYSMIKNEGYEDYFSYYKLKTEIETSTELQNKESNEFLSYFRFPEIINKKIQNQKELPNGELLTLTDFQSKIFNLLLDGYDIAFSAPTSGGKSYILHNYIAYKTLKEIAFTTVYLAPTKALIAEIQTSIRKTLLIFGLNSNEFIISTSINDLNIKEISSYQKRILILTQERLQEMQSNALMFDIDLIVVDEAQKIGDDGRGIIIEDTIHEVIKNNIKLQKVFISPYIKNLEIYKSIFDIKNNVLTETTSRSPVCQNIILVDFIKGRNKKAMITLLMNEFKDSIYKYIVIDEFALSSIEMPTSRIACKVWVTKKLIKANEPTIIYCDRPTDCINVAKQLLKEDSESTVTPEIKNVVEFLKEYVHKDYYLCDFLPQKIGYHYGKMPQFVKFSIKRTSIYFVFR